MKSTNNIVALRQLWKQCFDADSSFLDLYFGKGSGLFETYTIEDGPDIISALSVLPVEYQDTGEDTFTVSAPLPYTGDMDTQ